MSHQAQVRVQFDGLDEATSSRVDASFRRYPEHGCENVSTVLRTVRGGEGRKSSY